MVLIYAALAAALFWIIGVTAARSLKIDEGTLFGSDSLSLVLLGYPVFLTVCMTLGMLLPLYIVLIILLVATLVLSVIHRDALKHHLLSVWKNQQPKLQILLLVMTATGLPQLIKNELYISLFYNNDFAYYLASIDFLKDHRILDHVTYSKEYPFYSMAEYMLQNTRIGTDVTGAALSDLFRLQAHEIYPVLMVLSAFFVCSAAYKIIDGTTGNRAFACAFGFFAAFSGNLVELEIKQYIPQILGIAFLMLSLYLIHRFLEEESKENGILCAAACSTTIALYCEFTLYLVLFAVIMLVMAAIRRRFPILPMIKLIAGAAVCNVFATYRALMFNLWIFGRVAGGGSDTIDAYGGNIMGIRVVTASLLGMPEMFISDDARMMTWGLRILAAVLAIGAICAVVFLKDGRRRFVLGLLLVIVLLEGYFYATASAYQEFKHVTSMSVFSIVIIGISLASLNNTSGKWKVVSVLTAVAMAALLFAGIAKPFSFYCSHGYVVDDRIMALQDVAKTYAEGQEIEIDSSICVTNYMSAVYALKDYPVNLNTDSQSYLQYFQLFDDNDPSKYVLYEAAFPIEENGEQTVLWNNGIYQLVEREAG